ncbi:arsenic metallochaperone ArsD family protein [Nonomuraea sp. NPDC050786]|uniref:arsenic metallochaperone ArsD family protein n=1 Tax=Nonomuraea sp. NPDC050786 TaxID=3154840 RepID=UPI0033CEDE16
MLAVGKSDTPVDPFTVKRYWRGYREGNAMAFRVAEIEQDLRLFTDRGVVTAGEAEQILAIVSDSFPFAEAMDNAESIHVHVNVESVTSMSNEDAVVQACQEVINSDQERKFRFSSGLNVILASEPTAEDEFIPGAVTRQKPYVDHLGVDLREENAVTKKIFDSIPETAGNAGWRHIYQDGPVRCCYTEMGPKHWVYPPQADVWRPIEFAFGELKVSDEHLGCDYRPIDPGHPLAALARQSVPACETPATETTKATALSKIHIFEECTCNTSPSRPLVDFLSKRYEGVEVRAFDMAKPEGLVPLPPPLFLALENEGVRCLPALVVDGQVRTKGWLPNLMDAVKVIENPEEAGVPISRPASQASSSCCSTDQDCC